MNKRIALLLNLVLPDRNGCAALVKDRTPEESIRGMRT
jgi:hypothetical protein